LKMATLANPGELIGEAILRSSPSFVHPPWMRSEKQKIWALVAAPAQPKQMTKMGRDGLIAGDATPSLRRLPPLLPPEKNSDEEEGLDGPDLAKNIPPPTPILHKGSRQD
jgi:hypothetical protein